MARYVAVLCRHIRWLIPTAGKLLAETALANSGGSGVDGKTANPRSTTSSASHSEQGDFLMKNTFLNGESHRLKARNDLLTAIRNIVVAYDGDATDNNGAAVSTGAVVSHDPPSRRISPRQRVVVGAALVELLLVLAVSSPSSSPSSYGLNAAATTTNVRSPSPSSPMPTPTTVLEVAAAIVAASGGGRFMEEVDPSLATRLADFVLSEHYKSAAAGAAAANDCGEKGWEEGGKRVVALPATPVFLEGVPSRVLVEAYLSRGLFVGALSLLVQYPESIATSQEWLPLCMQLVVACTTTDGLVAGLAAAKAVSTWSRLIPSHVAVGWVLNAVLDTNTSSPSDATLLATLAFFTTVLKEKNLVGWQPTLRLVKECIARGFNVEELFLVVASSQQSTPLCARVLSALAVTHPWYALRLLELILHSGVYPHFSMHKLAGRVEVRAVLGLVWDRSASKSAYTWLLQELELFVQPWRCATCFGFNKGHTFTCVRCHSLAPPWQCAGCSSWVVGGAVSCKKCGGSIDAARWKGENSTHFWSCGECLGQNSPSSHPTSCHACGAPRKKQVINHDLSKGEVANAAINGSDKRNLVTSTTSSRGPRRVCGGCSLDLTLSLDPWCGTCGWIAASHSDNCRGANTAPAAAPSDSSPSLWRCQWCRRLNPWTNSSCSHCKEVNFGAAPTVKWFQWVCSGCSFNHNPAWSNRCRSCDAEHDPLSTTRPKCRLCSSALSGDDLKCDACGSGTQRWVCLQHGCLHINDEHAMSCAGCTSKRPELSLDEELALGYTVDEPALRMRSARAPPTPPNGKCDLCGTRLPCGVLQLCQGCSAPEVSRALPRTGLWKLIDLVASKVNPQSVAISDKSRPEQGKSRDTTTPSCSGSSEEDTRVASIAIVKSALGQLQKAEVQERLPWRGRDLESGLLCVAQDNPVYRDGTTHSSLNTVRDTIKGLVNSATREPPGQQRTDVLVAALSLVSLVNASTRYDELGFDEVLLPLMVAVRREQQRELDAATELHARQEYLMEMKLDVELIVGPEMCVSCLMARSSCGCRGRRGGGDESSALSRCE